MSTQWSNIVDMNMTGLLPFLCIAYALLPKKARPLPINTNLGKIDNPSSIHGATLNYSDEGFTLKGPPEIDIGFSSIALSESDDMSVSHPEVRKKNKAIGGEPLAPEYMLDLYNRFSRNNRDLPTSNIVRSFKNVNLKDEALNENSDKDIDFREGTKNVVRVLTFNVSSIAKREKVSLAELRVFSVIEQDKNAYFGVDRTISVLDIIESESPETLTNSQYNLVTSRRVYGHSDDWEVFNITSAVERWVKSDKPLHKIEIRIEPPKWRLSFGLMDIETTPNVNKEPLLLVYSNDNSKHSEHEDERHDLISHELNTHSVTGSVKSGNGHSKPSDIYLENGPEANVSRQKRSKPFYKSSVCRRRPMYVDFEDIGWDTWIIAPRGYQAYQCVGKCYFPVNEHLSPSKHAIIQSMIHSQYPKKAVRTCCVPTRLEPISILYYDEQGVLTYKYKYDGMVVAECGCR